MDKKTSPCQVTDEMLSELESSLSPERLSRYLVETSGDKKKALHLYAWNTSVSAAFYEPLQAVEVVLRNAMHNRLSEAHGANWYDNVSLIDKNSRQLETAKSNLRKEPGGANPPNVVASLSFGFWVLLLSHQYEMTLWRPTLRKAFPHIRTIKRRQVHVPLKELKDLRNRIAHHRPIFFHPLRERYRDLLEVIRWISPHTKKWVAAHSRVEAILEERRGSFNLQL